jgi:hypothetical protein
MSPRRSIRVRAVQPAAADPPKPTTAPEMAVKRTAARSREISVDNLEQLGARHLAELLVTHAEGDQLLARSLRLALAETDGTSRLAAEIAKRLRTIRRSRGFVAWDKVKELARELEQLRETIAGKLAAVSPADAVAQMRALLDLSGSVFERSDDSSGYLGDVFRQAAADLGRLWATVPDRDPAALAAEVLATMDADGYGVTDRLLAAAGSALGAEGRAELRRLLQARLAGLPRQADDKGGLNSHGRRETASRLAELADLEEDVDAYIEAMDLGGMARSHTPAIAERLLAHGRDEAALDWLDNGPRHAGEMVRYADLRIAALEALGRQSEAQALRREVFERSLSVTHLREYLRRLPDFDDVEAEQQAITHVLAHKDRHQALAFLIAWPNLEAANRLVLETIDQLDGRDYVHLRPAAEVLVAKYPLAATLLHRRLAEDVLRRAASRYYKYAALDVRACESLSPMLPLGSEVEAHADFMTRLKREHSRKAGFWSLLREDDH